MKKGFAIFLAATITLLFFASCDKEKQGNECVSYNTAQVTKVTGLKTILVNQETNLTVSY